MDNETTNHNVDTLFQSSSQKNKPHSSSSGLENIPEHTQQQEGARNMPLQSRPNLQKTIHTDGLTSLVNGI